MQTSRDWYFKAVYWTMRRRLMITVSVVQQTLEIFLLAGAASKTIETWSVAVRLEIICFKADWTDQMIWQISVLLSFVLVVIHFSSYLFLVCQIILVLVLGFMYKRPVSFVLVFAPLPLPLSLRLWSHPTCWRYINKIIIIIIIIIVYKYNTGTSGYRILLFIPSGVTPWGGIASS